MTYFWNDKDGLRINLLLVNRLQLSTCQLYRANEDEFQTHFILYQRCWLPDRQNVWLFINL